VGSIHEPVMSVIQAETDLHMVGTEAVGTREALSKAATVRDC
jgi:hypothetical protein